jgi:hypothetical protein
LPWISKVRGGIATAKRMRQLIKVFGESNPSWSTYSSNSNAAYDIETDQVVVDGRNPNFNTILNLILPK